jgi:hypothetical protein
MDRRTPATSTADALFPRCLHAASRASRYNHANRELVYDLLFRCVSETLLEFGRDPDRLGGEIGVTTVLHTWSRDLTYHPHLHCITTGGALSCDGATWFAARPKHLFPVEALGILFRGKLLDGLKRLEQKQKLRVSDPKRFASIITALYRKDWNVYCKRPFGGPEQVIKYLGQYTHRVAISNYRRRDVSYQEWPDGSA